MLPHRTMVLSRPRLLHRAMSGSVVQHALGSELISVVLVITKGYVVVKGMESYQRPCLCLKALLLPGPY